MNVLIVDTATEACSCALICGDQVLSRSEFAPRRHTELVLPMVDSVLAEASLVPAQLTGIAFGCGPGSFTGLRIACGVVQGIAFGLDLPVAAISDLAALAQMTYHRHGATQVLASIDARMAEVYWGCYRLNADNCMQLMGEEVVIAPEAVSVAEAGTWVGAGSGWDTFADALTQQVKAQGSQLEKWWPELLPDAVDMAPLVRAAFAAGDVMAAEQAMPVYLRNQVVKT